MILLQQLDVLLWIIWMNNLIEENMLGKNIEMNKPTLIERLRHHSTHPVEGQNIGDQYFHELFERAADCIAQIDVLFRFAFIRGYETGHNDTVEGCYTDSGEVAIDALHEAKEDGSFQAALEQNND